MAALLTTPLVQADENQLNEFSVFQQKAKQFNAVFELPQWETTPEEVKEATASSIARANAALDNIGALKPDAVTFENTVRALDDIYFDAGLAGSRIYLLKEASPNGVLRDAATEMVKVFEDWSVGLDYREDVYKAVKAFADTKPPLKGEDAKLLEETLRDYRRAGLALPKEERDEVERLRKELAKLSTDFDSNVTKAERALKFTKDQLQGVPEHFLQQLKTGDDEYTVMANVTWQFVTVMENAEDEATRKQLKTARYSLAKRENIPLLKEILKLRQDIAAKLGYPSWADFQIEPRMAKNAGTARDFLLQLKNGLQPKFEAEIEAFRKLKAEETGNENAKIHIWDWRYYSNRLKKEQYNIDTEQLRVFFPYDKTLQGMFDIFEEIFRLDIQRVAPPYKWVEDLQLYVVSDSKTGEPLGAFYLDMFPREGKFNHFAKFGIIPGKRLAGGEYQRPVVALICNFPAPQPDRPSLLSHSDVETLFHEFGHALHSILTRANYQRFSGTSVPRDFVEAPSQMLENWVWDKSVLDRFAADYRDPSRKIPEDVLQKMEEARLATVGSFYRRQLAFALLDLTLHAAPQGQASRPVKISNEILSDVFLPVPEDTAFVAYFGHLTGYDAGYYGYAWADAIAADLATVFKKADRGYFDADAGLRLREEIYAPGSARDVEESIRVFLGRPRSLGPFLESIGIPPEKQSLESDKGRAD